MLCSYMAVWPITLHSTPTPPTTVFRISHGCWDGSHVRSRLSVPRSSRRSLSSRTKRLVGSYTQFSLYKPSISYAAPTGSNYSKTLYRNYFWKRGHFLNQYTQSPEWRLLSSWGKQARQARGEFRGTEGSAKDDSLHKEIKEDDWYDMWQKRHRATLKHFEEMKKMIDEDPYKALFGRHMPESWYTSEKTSCGKEATGDVPKSTNGQSEAGEAASKDAESTAKPCRPINERSSSSNSTPRATHGHSEEFFIDPITMRKIPRAAPKEKRSSSASSNTSARPVSIPVKTFTASSPKIREVNGSESAGQTVETVQEGKQDWLRREGFSTWREDRSPASGKQQASSTRIESALDRHQKRSRTSAAEELKETVALAYDPKESQTDDVDLLTASDIRASAGCRGRLASETAKEKEDRRQILEKDYDQRPLDLEEQLAAELAAQKVKSEVDLMGELEEKAKGQRKRDAAKNAHEVEVENQKVAMEAHEMFRSSNITASSGQRPELSQQGEGDMASNVHEFGSRDRWYKRKAPHANAEAEQKLLQASRDKEFVREIKSIYEESYGTIDTKHRQPLSQASVEDSQYPSDAFPGTVYEQPWTAHILNDHPDIDATGALPPTEHSQLQNHYEKQNFQALSLIGKLFNEMRENQALLHEHRAQLQELAYKNSSQSLFQSLKKREQRIMDTLKSAQSLFKSTTTATALKNESLEPNIISSALDTPSHEAAIEEENSVEKRTVEPPTLYKILAYDPSIQRVTTTKTTSFVGTVIGKPVSFSEALFGLENPARFLPHFLSLKTGEYQFAAGGPNLLIFKKVRQLKPSLEEKAPEESLWHANPIDGMVASTGNFASPTGFVNYDPPLPEPAPQETPEAAPKVAKGNHKVRRQEEVFSGSSRRAWHDQYERNTSSGAKTKGKHRRAVRRRQTVKRMLWVGALTATGCYAVGVASEFLRL